MIKGIVLLRRFTIGWLKPSSKRLSGSAANDDCSDKVA